MVHSKPGMKRAHLALVAAFLILIGAAVTAGRAGDAQKVTIINGSRSVIIGLQLKPKDGAWNEILGRKRLGIRQKTVYELPHGPCAHYDIRAVFNDGRSLNKTDQNLCVSSYLLTDF